jgi:hypothetical protein
MGALLVATATGVQADIKIQGAGICHKTGDGNSLTIVQGMQTTGGIRCDIQRDNTTTTTGLSDIRLETRDSTLCSVYSVSSTTGSTLDSVSDSRIGTGNYTHDFDDAINISQNGTSFYFAYCTDTGGNTGYLRAIKYTEN